MFKYIFSLMLLIIASIYAAEIPKKLNVVTSIRPIHSMVSAVMGDTGSPKLLLDNHQTPHHPTLKPSQINMLHQANIIFIIDPSFETFLIKPLKSISKQTAVINLENAEGIHKLPYRTSHDHGNIDGHIWLNPLNAIAMLDKITETLSQYDPENKLKYQKNAKSYQNRIIKLDQAIQKQLAPVKQKPFLVFHDGYQYFEKHYQLNGQGSIVFEPDAPLKASRLQEIEQEIKSKGIICIFQDAPGNTRIIKMMRENFKINCQVLDPLGINITKGSKLYLELLNNMSEQFLKCLS